MGDDGAGKLCQLYCFLLIIGLPSFFLGCNFEATNFCPAYNLRLYQVYDVYAKKDKNDNYAYHAYVKFENVSCQLNAGTFGETSREHVERKADERYQIGENVLVLERRNDRKVCTRLCDAKSDWTVGLVFLCLAAFIPFCACSCGGYFALMDRCKGRSSTSSRAVVALRPTDPEYAAVDSGRPVQTTAAVVNHNDIEAGVELGDFGSSEKDQYIEIKADEVIVPESPVKAVPLAAEIDRSGGRGGRGGLFDASAAVTSTQPSTTVPASSATAAGGAAASPRYRVGDRVEADYGGHGAYLPATIDRIAMDGTYDLRYDRGDLEFFIPERLIRPLDSSTTP